LLDPSPTAPLVSSTRRARRRWVAAGAALVVSSAAAAWAVPPVPASNGDGMDTHLFRPAVDSKGFFTVNGTDVLGAGEVSFGLILDYGRNLMRLNKDRPDRGANQLIANGFQGTFGVNYGIADRAEVGVTVPVVLMEGDAANQIGPNGGFYNSDKLDAQDLTSVALHAKLRITRMHTGIGLAALVQGGIPISSSPRDLAADPGFWYWPQLIAEDEFGSEQQFKIGIEGGYRGHTGKNPMFQLDPTGQPQLAEGEIEYGNLATFGAALSYRALDPLDLVAETYGTYLLASNTDSKQKLSQEVVGGIKLFVEKNSYLMMGGGSRYGAVSSGFEAADVRIFLGFVFEPSIDDRDGDGIADDVDQCPDQPEDKDGFQDADGCPDLDNDHDGVPDDQDKCPNTPGPASNHGCPLSGMGDRDGDGILDKYDKCPDQPEDKDGFQDADGCPDLDNDHDGIPDAQDKCPNQPEDKDGFQDADGCPDLDNDHDGIPDSRDKCPNQPETYNGFQDEDGCPDQGRVIVENNNIVILDKVQFATGSAKILTKSNAILDAVAATLKGHPEFKVVEIGGHADERGSNSLNLRLTKARAHSVLEALIARGVDKSRLVSQGYGEYCPLDKEHNPKAWAENRRVEFKIVKTDEGLTDAARGCPTAIAHGVKPPAVH
jgi:OmpA-OmpF porin, OOP family